jgi:hypothetical protein
MVDPGLEFMCVWRPFFYMVFLTGLWSLPAPSAGLLSMTQSVVVLNLFDMQTSSWLWLSAA